MKQRVKLAQALVHDPTIVLLDEPTAGLDPAGREEMLSLVQRTGRDFGISIMLSTHLMGDVESACDRIIVLDHGQVVESGDVSNFTRETETVFVDVDDHLEELVSALESRGIKPTMEGVSVAIQDVGDAEYDMIRDALVEAGSRLRRLGPRRHQLTEIFRDNN
jgi:ABC-2 type transport system ATP-binding protein